MAKATKTIYKVEGVAPGESSPESGPFSDDFLELAPATVRGRAPAARFGRGRLFWVIIGVVILTIVMIVAIAIMGATESPAAGISMDTSTSSTLAAVVGTPTGRHW